MKLFPRLTLAALLAPALLGAAAHADEVMTKDGILVNQAGMTVYTFDKDTAGSPSVCSGQCAEMWPFVPAPAKVMAPYSAIARDDGAKQLAINGKPLYTFKKDTKPGERNGDNFKTFWHVVKE